MKIAQFIEAAVSQIYSATSSVPLTLLSHFCSPFAYLVSQFGSCEQHNKLTSIQHRHNRTFTASVIVGVPFQHCDSS